MMDSIGGTGVRQGRLTRAGPERSDRLSAARPDPDVRAWPLGAVPECPAAYVVWCPAHSLGGAAAFLPVVDIEDLAVTGSSGQPDYLLIPCHRPCRQSPRYLPR